MPTPDKRSHGQHLQKADRFHNCHGCLGQIGPGETMTVWMFPDSSSCYIHTSCIEDFKAKVVRLTLLGVL